MTQGRGSAVAITALMLSLLLLHTGVAQAATYVVGGTAGWTYNMAGWPKGKSFRAGDTLAFNYKSGIHNVVVVDRNGYKSCNAPPRAKVYSTGKDQVKLTKGQNFFICTIPGHCQAGMKIAIIAV